MSKYFGVDGKKVGKVGGEKYYIDKGENIVQKSNKYYPVNSTLLKRKKFKEYVLSLFDEGIPQIYVLDELPEELYPYALLFVKNGEENYKVYVDKEEVRTEIKLGEDDYDAVDIVNNVPEEPRNNTVYFVNQPENKNKEKNVAEYEIYVCDNDELKKIELKGTDIPELEQIKQVVNDVVSKSLKNVYNTNLTANKVVITDTEGRLRAGNTDPVDLDLHLYWVANGSLRNILDRTVTANKVIVSDSSGYLAASNISSTDVGNVLIGVTTKSLKNVYNNVLQANKDIVTDASGYLTTAEKPHLYAHHYHYDHSGRGEVNFVIYSKKSTELGNSELGTYLKNLGCDESFRAYPANGQNQANGAIVTGIFIKPSGSSFVPYTIWVTSYNIGSMFTEEISNYPGTHFIKIVQIY